MDDGIRIEDAAVEISPAGLEAMLAKKGADVKVTRLECSVSEEALNALLKRFAPGPGVPHASVADGHLAVENVGPDGNVRLELEASGIRLEITADGLRLRMGSEG